MKWPCSLNRGHSCTWIVVVLILLNGSASAAFKNVELGASAPVVSGRDILSGGKVSSKTMIAEGATVVVVVFWATWSPRSAELLAEMKRINGDTTDPRLQVLAVNVEGETLSPGARSAIDELLADMALPFPVILDTGLELFQAFGVIAVPSAAVLDNNHVLRADPAGFSLAAREALTDTITVLLGGQVGHVLAEKQKGYQPNRKALRLYNKGMRLLATGLLERAERDADRAAASDTLFASPHTLRGRVMLAMGDAEAAAESFGRAARLDSTSVAALAGWGRALFELEDFVQAEAVLRRAIDRDDSFTPAVLDLASCLRATGDEDGAGTLLQAAVDLNPRDPETLFRYGAWLRTKGRVAEALDAYRTALGQLGHQ